MVSSKQAAERGLDVLAKDAAGPPAPHISDAEWDCHVGVIGRVSCIVAVTMHDVRTEIRGEPPVVHPHLESKAVARQFVQCAAGVLAGGREVAV
jgi:hypothetical protein